MLFWGLGSLMDASGRDYGRQAPFRLSIILSFLCLRVLRAFPASAQGYGGQVCEVFSIVNYFMSFHRVSICVVGPNSTM